MPGGTTLSLSLSFDTSPGYSLVMTGYHSDKDLYLKRLKRLEEIAESFDGVERCFAIQAGREVRIMVKPDKIDDLASIRLAKDIVKQIESDMDYPGQIRVTVIRETRAVDYAK